MVFTQPNTQHILHPQIPNTQHIIHPQIPNTQHILHSQVPNFPQYNTQFFYPEQYNTYPYTSQIMPIHNPQYIPMPQVHTLQSTEQPVIYPSIYYR